MNQNPGIMGKKLGMTQIYAPDGSVLRCTVIDATAVVVGKRTEEKDGYTALILGMGDRKESHTNKAQLGAAKKSGQPAKKITREMRCTKEFAAAQELGKVLPLSQVFEEGQKIDVQGVTIGRGFTGVMKRWSFAGFPMTHGTHEYRRHGGSIGTNMTPGRTKPGMKMPGHYGSETVSVLNVKVAKIMEAEGLLLVDGGVPGAKNSIVFVRGAIKKKNAGKKTALELFVESRGRPSLETRRPFAFSGPVHSRERRLEQRTELATTHAELPQRASDQHADGARGDAELRCDLLVREAFCGETRGGALARGERPADRCARVLADDQEFAPVDGERSDRSPALCEVAAPLGQCRDALRSDAPALGGPGDAQRLREGRDGQVSRGRRRVHDEASSQLARHRDLRGKSLFDDGG
jgi:large subunit ribosomal protein L3